MKSILTRRFSPPPPGEKFSSDEMHEDPGLKFLLSLLHSSSSVASAPASPASPASASNPANLECDLTSSGDDDSDDDDITQEELDLYNHRRYESQCFDVPSCAWSLMDAVVPMDIGCSGSTYNEVKGYVFMAINQWNSDSQNARIEFVEIIRTTCQCGLTDYFYITFRARDMYDNKENFETKIANTVSGDFVEFVRYQRHYPNAPGREDLDLDLDLNLEDSHSSLSTNVECQKS